MLTVDRSLQKAWIYSWIMKNSRHGIQISFRRIGHSSFELGTTDNSQQVYKRLLCASFWFDTWPCHLRRTHIRPHIRSYQARYEIWEGPPRPHFCVVIPAIRHFCAHWRSEKRHDRLLTDTVQIICTLKNIKSFLGLYPSDLLPHYSTTSWHFSWPLSIWSITTLFNNKLALL